MSSFPSYPRDPASILEWSWDWQGGPPGPWLAEGETITAATVTVPEGISQPQPESFDDTTVTVWVSGGTAGQEYDVTAHITTNQGRQDERTIKLITQER